MSYTEISASYPTGRKDYSCEWCSQKIICGEKHFQRTYVFEGDFTNGRMHLECEKAMNKTSPHELSDGWAPGDYSRPVADPAISPAHDGSGKG